MELWFLLPLALSLSFCLGLKSIIHHLSLPKSTQSKLSLPPGPLKVPIIGSFVFLRISSPFKMEPILRNLCHKYGPIITLHIGSHPAIFITNHSLAHQALVENGTVFADRHPLGSPSRIVNNNPLSINSAPYGPVWRLLRRNITYEILHPSRVKSYGHGRRWVLQILIKRLRNHVQSGESAPVIDHFQYAMFCLVVLMCFGGKYDEKIIREIEYVQRTLIVNLRRFSVLAFLPKLGKIIFRNRWNQLLELRRRQESVLIPIIRARREIKKKKQDTGNPDDEFLVSYVDTLFDLKIPDDGRNLTEGEIMTLCSEFLNGGTDTTATELQWIMANLVKNQGVQEKLYSEIEGVVNSGEEIREEDLQKMPYLKAVVLEGLRRHPPSHFVLPHAVTEDIVLDGHVIPKKATVNFMVAEMGWDPKVWKDPMEFKPERFLSEEGVVFDITGSREVKMMPFGVGRRICPGIGLAMLHLEYFVANLIRDFKWTAVDGDDVDLSEKPDFTIVMKNPLRAHISPRVP